MKINSKFCGLVMAALLIITIVACQSYQRQVVPFKMPPAYPNVTEAAGALIAAKAYDSEKEAEAAFGFDIRGAGIFPVMVVFDNKGKHPIEIVAAQTFLVDSENNLWPVIDASLAYDRISKKTELGKVAPEGAKAGLLAGAAGAIIGAAVGIVSGDNVGDAVMKGTAVGAAAGLTMGGAGGLLNQDVQREIREDLETRSLESRPVTPHEIAHGFIFFPGEAKQAKELRLRIREVDSGVSHALIMKF